VEGVVGLSALLGREISGQKVIVQAPVTALRMTSVDCKVAFDESAAVRIVMLQFAQRLHDIASQTAPATASTSSRSAAPAGGAAMGN
jgi:hypothetical protein